MDHSEAVRLQAAEKYVLGELQGAVRDEYEEHYFGCVECAAEVKSTAAFAALSRAAFREDAVAAPVAKPAPEPRVSWAQRFRWAFAAVPAFAALLVVVFYQNGVTIPELRSKASLASASTSNPPLELGAAALRRGNSESVNAAPYLIDPAQGFAISFDFTPPAPHQPAYVCQLKDAS